MDQIKTILPHTWVITLTTRSSVANCEKKKTPYPNPKTNKKAQVTAYQRTFKFSSESSLLVNSFTDTATGAI